ncbi:hypothetical protein F5J12DRAFT_795509 [Pisolithus orientalis]|uniref:uncharacterized protein n=1 Tax=Pisolithus orientalis TaxID=936130 RepID=UPI002225647F|nr:uncharacterized protein F5J12DRAFT_795509 [Pisolithus orientalis]KAI6032624.1 hypothetical protein F5J12DRAFT_795509 [Pisolithus orientalis]
MSLVLAAFWVLYFWLVVYGVKHCSRNSRQLLPFSQVRKPTVEVAVKNFHLRVKTDALNALHDGLCKSLSSDEFRRIKRALLHLYNLGSMVGIISMIAALLLLWSMTANLVMSVVWTPFNSSSTSLVKRNLEGGVGEPIPVTTPVDSGAFSVRAIIPGVTVPLGHFPIILLALCICQVVHEVGHAIAAAVRHVPILFSGFAVTVVFPSVFVVLPVVRLERLRAVDRLQVAAAGCFHNLAFWCLLYLVTWTEISTFLSEFLFEDVSRLGKVVVGVHPGSPLQSYIPSGAIVTMLDDTMLSVTESAPTSDPWDEFLLSPSTPVVTRGWCFENSGLANASSSLKCQSTDSRLCFVLMHGTSDQYSLDAVTVLSGDLARCDASVGCTPLSSCVMPRRGQQLVRITLLSNSLNGSEEVVLWKGPRREIWEQVEVSTFRSRIPLISNRVRRYIVDFVEYMKLINLSLYLVNMLPIPALDGFQLLATLLELIFGREYESGSIDLEAGSHSSGAVIDRTRETPVQRIIQATLSTSTVTLVTLNVLLPAIQYILH